MRYVALMLSTLFLIAGCASVQALNFEDDEHALGLKEVGSNYALENDENEVECLLGHDTNKEAGLWLWRGMEGADIERITADGGRILGGDIIFYPDGDTPNLIEERGGFLMVCDRIVSRLNQLTAYLLYRTDPLFIEMEVYKEEYGHVVHVLLYREINEGTYELIELFRQIRDALGAFENNFP